VKLKIFQPIISDRIVTVFREYRLFLVQPWTVQKSGSESMRRAIRKVSRDVFYIIIAIDPVSERVLFPVSLYSPAFVLFLCAAALKPTNIPIN
jgi:hypothetical protein